MKYIVRRLRGAAKGVPLWGGMGIGENPKIFDTREAAESAIEGCNNPILGAITIVGIDADAHLPICEVCEQRLFEDHTVYFVRYDKWSGMWHRYVVDGITQYTYGYNYIIHLRDRAEIGFDQLTVEPSERLEIKYNPEVK